ncbi:MAG: hypothetical protein J5I50_01285 [Chitinophagaceae bacterium]|nr:hypothetical protein [Chitinophagaceae bacterium]
MKTQSPIKTFSATMRSIKLLTAFLLTGCFAWAQQPVQVNVIVQQPVSPYLPQLAAEIQNQQFQGLTQKLMIRITNTSRTPQRVKLSGRIERLAPTPMSVSLRPDYRPSQPIILGPQQTIQLDRDLIEQAFGNFSRSQLMFENLDLSALRQNAVNYKLPEGTYRICVNAYDYDVPGQSRPLSPVGAGCATFRICYTASAPQFTMPVSTLTGGLRGVTTFTPKSSQIQFAWTPPSSTCGLPMRGVTYDLEIKEIFPGQAINDALYNPYTFRQQNLMRPGFILDTMKYPNVFRAGKKYVVRVKANLMRNASDPLEIANQGYSEIASFEYKPESRWQRKGSKEPKYFAVTGSGDCDIVNKVDGSSPLYTGTLNAGDIIHVGDFDMKLKAGVVQNDDTYSGSGTIMWKPYGKDIMLNVVFDGIRVNQKKQLLAGVVTTTWDHAAGDDFLNLSLPDFGNKVNNLVGSKVNPIINRVNKIANQIKQITGDAPVDFPLGLNNEDIGGVNTTLAITGIIFSSTGTDMRMLFSMNIPDAGTANEWLSLAGAKFCIKRDGFSFSNGLLFLPSDRHINLGGTTFTLKGAADGIAGEIDTTNTTYLKWSTANGFEKVFVKADLTMPDQMRAVKENGTPTGEKLKLTAKFDFREWDDWIADLSFTDKFDFKALPGFQIQATSGFYYDHSSKRNAPGLSSPSMFPAGYAEKGGTVDNTFKGFYMPNLGMYFPKDFVVSRSAAVNFNGLIIDDAGVTMNISATDVIKKGDNGTLGGWGFVVDSIKIPIVRNNLYQTMSMRGSVWLPISETGLGYTCLLNKGENEGDGYTYSFNIQPKEQMDMDIWKAVLSLSSDSRFAVVKEKDKDVYVEAQLTGGISIHFDASGAGIPVSGNIPLLGIKNLNVSNKDGFSMGLESITLGEVPIQKGNKPSSAYNDTYENLPMYAVNGGPNAENEFYLQEKNDFIPEETEGHLSGFAFTIDNFELKRPKTGEVGLFFDLSVNVGFGDVAAVSGGTNLGVVARYSMMGLKPKVEFSRVAVESVYLSGGFGPVDIDGRLDFWSGNATYGEGVHGKVHANFNFAEIDAEAYFGTKGNIKYGGVGGKFFTAAGIPIFGGLMLNGFGGGYFSNMGIEDVNFDKIRNAGEDAKLSMIPQSGTNTLQANIIVTYANPTIVNASLTVTMPISNGGLTELVLNGDGHIITTPADYKKGLVDAAVDMRFGFASATYDATIDVKASTGFADLHIPVWMHGGGRGANAKYYLYVGRPDRGDDDKVTAEMGFGDEGDMVYAKLTATAYLCMGVGEGSLPAFPPLPEKIRTFLQGGSGHQVTKPNGATSPEQNAQAITQFLKSNATGGLMFGAAVDAKLGLDFLIFYAKANGMIGFDLAMVETKPGKTGACNVDGAIGYNGYYAIGQLYAYFGMDVGVHLGAGDLPLVSLQLGAYLRGGLPNPTWGEGMVKIQGSIVGLIDVNETVAFDFGTKCYPEYDPLAHLELIAETSPSEISIFDYPYVAFNVPVSGGGQTDEGYKLKDKNGNVITDGVVSYPNPPDENHTLPFNRFYVFKATYTELKATNDNTDAYPVNIQYTNDNRVANYLKDQEFVQDRDYSFKVTVVAYQYQEDKSLKEVMKQEKIVNFRTKIAGADLNKSQIAYTYPIQGQRYLLKNEFSGKGGLRFIQAPRMERVPLNDPKFKKVVQFIPEFGSSDTLSTSFTWSPGSTEQISFQLPAGLKLNQGYRMNLMLVPVDATQMLEKDMTQSTNQLVIKAKNNGNIAAHNAAVKAAFDNTGTGATNWDNVISSTPKNQNLVLNMKSTGVMERATSVYGVSLYSIDFHTSKYNTFKEKISGHTVSVKHGATANLINFSISTKDEPFDVFEVNKFQTGLGTTEFFPPLFRIEVPTNINLVTAAADKVTDVASSYNKLTDGNDQWMLFNTYRYGSSVPLNGLKIDWGWSEVRNAPFLFKPIYEFTTSNNNPSQPYVYETWNAKNARTQGGIKISTRGGTASYLNTDGWLQVASANAGSSAGGGSTSSSTAAPAQATFTRLPASYTSAFSGGGGSMNYDAMQQKNGGLVVVQPGSTSQNTRPVINYIWMRDFYYSMDFNLFEGAVKSYFENMGYINDKLAQYDKAEEALKAAHMPVPANGRTNLQHKLFNDYQVLATGANGAVVKISNYNYLFGSQKNDLSRDMFAIAVKKQRSFQRFPSVQGRKYKLSYNNPFKANTASTVEGKFNYTK